MWRGVETMNKNLILFVVTILMLMGVSSVNAQAVNCTANWECNFLTNDCSFGVCDTGVCQAVLNDTRGPDVSNIMVDPNPSNGIFSVSALTSDVCSPISSALFYVDNKCVSDGVDLNAQDGTYDELEELVERNNYDSDVDDGAHNLWVNAQDEEGNIGACKGVSFEVDTLPPKVEYKEIVDYKWKDEQGTWICADNAQLNARLCDPIDQSLITGAEYLVDKFGVPIGEGYMMSPVDGTYNEVCEDVYAPIENEEFSEGRHDARVRGEDSSGNWGKLLNQNSSYFIIDRTAPQTDKDLDGAKIRCDITYDGENQVESCWYITQDTTISLSCADIDAGNGYFSNDVNLYYRTRYTFELNETWGNWSEWTLYDDPFNFNEDSVHEIEYYCADACLNEEEHHFELDLVDTKAPDALRDINGPQHVCEEEEGCDFYVSQDSEITLTCQDKQPHPVEDTILYWRAYANGTSEEYAVTDTSVTFSFDEDGAQLVDYYCDDGLGNVGDTANEVYFVDTRAPVLTKTVGEPKLECANGECDWWITQDTEISFACTDEGDFAVDHQETYSRYQVDGGTWSNWSLYDDAFTFGEDSEHRLEYYCADALNNQAGVYSELDKVDTTAPTTTKLVKDPKYDKQDGFDWWITQNTQICLETEDGGEICHVDGVQTYYRVNLDNGGWGNWTLYSGCFNYDEDSNHTIEYYSIDLLNNTEEVQSNSDSVDTAAPELEKSVVVDGESMFEQGYANSNSELSICVNAHDVKLTGDDGVGTNDDSVTAYLDGEDWQVTLPLEKVDDEYYCGEWEPEQCDLVQVDASASDYLDNYNRENGLHIIVENGLPDAGVMTPHSGEYYHDGKKFTVYAPAVDEPEENTECLVSGVKECNFFALDFCYDCVNENKSQLLHQNNITAFLDELGVDYTMVSLGTVPYVSGACSGTLEIPDNSGLSGVVLMSVEVSDNAGNTKHRLAINPLWDPITMNIDNDGPRVEIIDGLDQSTYTSGDLVKLIATVEDYDSQPSTCRLDLYDYTNESDTELVVEGLAWADVRNYKCSVSAVIPQYANNRLLTDGDYRLEVVALDNEDNVGSDWESFMLDNSNPQMGVISPGKGGVFSEIFSVSLDISDSLSSIVDESVRFRFHEAGNYGNLWCLFGCSDTGWISSIKYGDLYVGTVNTTTYNLTDGNYNFDAVACDVFYIPDESNPVGVDMNLDRNSMHCRQISEHGADEEIRAECNDGIDNDFDGLIDLSDDGCTSLDDDGEL